MARDFQADIAAVKQIAAVPTILEVVCRTTGMGFAAIARVTEDRWIACSVKDDIQFGLQPGGELQIETTICNEIRQHREPVVIDNVAEDPAYCGHHTPAKYGFQSYISMPIVLPNGSFFGTLCAIDPRPARLSTPEVVGMFKLFAELIAFHLDAIERMESSHASLLDERKNSELREQFIAVLGHDLRNPLAAIDAGCRMLKRAPLDQKSSQFVELIQSSVSRMSVLIDNVLDFARGRLGGGLSVSRNIGKPVEPVLNQVVAELRAISTSRRIETHFTMTKPVMADATRIGQLLSNLISNAVTYGAADSPVHVRASTEGETFELSVSNIGEPISPAGMERLFEPFTRGDVQPSQQGLGLGLYIASQIARAHGGALTASSSPEETRFTFRMPLN